VEPVTFNEHSYRSFEVDGHGGGVSCLNHLDTTAHIGLFATGKRVPATGQLLWPITEAYGDPRLSPVIPQRRATGSRGLHFFGHHEISWEAGSPS